MFFFYVRGMLHRLMLFLVHSIYFWLTFGALNTGFPCPTDTLAEATKRNISKWQRDNTENNLLNKKAGKSNNNRRRMPRRQFVTKGVNKGTESRANNGKRMTADWNIENSKYTLENYWHGAGQGNKQYKGRIYWINKFKGFSSARPESEWKKSSFVVWGTHHQVVKMWNECTPHQRSHIRWIQMAFGDVRHESFAGLSMCCQIIQKEKNQTKKSTLQTDNRLIEKLTVSCTMR